MDTKNNLIGESSSFLQILEYISQVAPLNKPILVVGERGTGKELVAERLHFLSGRWERPFLKLNCAAISESLIESELFGHESGAFTGANKKRPGRFELADQGTLFLDELATTSSRVQEKLLRVIEYGEFERVGGTQTIDVDVRLVAATNEDLPSLAADNQFRADLLDRLAFDVITLPPLRARRSDILLLAEHFAIKMTKELEREYFSGFSERIQQQLLDYDWPGNIRELKNVVERNVYRHPADEMIDHIIFDPFQSPYRPVKKVATNKKEAPSDTHPKQNLPSTIGDDTETAEYSSSALSSSKHSSSEHSSSEQLSSLQLPFDFKEQSQTYEIKILQQALEQSQYNQKKTAENLKLTYHQLRGYLKKYNLLEN